MFRCEVVVRGVRQKRTYLEHGQEKVFLTTLVLVSIDGKHDCLEKRVDLSHRDKSAQVGNVSRLRLEEEQEVSVFLSPVIIRKHAFLEVGSILEVARNFVLLVSQMLGTANR